MPQTPRTWQPEDKALHLLINQNSKHLDDESCITIIAELKAYTSYFLDKCNSLTLTLDNTKL